MYEGIYDVLHGELEMLEEKYTKDGNLTAQDLETIDKCAHALKCMATYDAMREASRPSRNRRDDYWRR